MKFTAAALAAVALAACGADSDDSQSASTPAPADSAPAVSGGSVDSVAPNGESVTVDALDNKFVEPELTIVAGTEVVFDNKGRNDHNVVPEDDPKATTWGVLTDGFHPGDTYAHVFSTPGTYVYYCTIHGTATAGMFGTITVTAP